MVGFGKNGEKEIPYEKFIGKYVLITTKNGVWGGMYQGLSRDGDYVLNPYENIIFTENGPMSALMEEDNYLVPEDVLGFRPTTRINLDNHVRYSNLGYEIEMREKVVKLKRLISEEYSENLSRRNRLRGNPAKFLQKFRRK